MNKKPRYIRWFDEAIDMASSKLGDYGESKKRVEDIATIYNAIKPEYKISDTVKTAYTLIALKLSRQKYHNKEDNLRDLLCYVAILADLLYGDIQSDGIEKRL